MATNFNIDEIFEMALQIERNGASFYRKAAKQCDDSRLKNLLMELANMEDSHQVIFSAMRKEFAGNVPKDFDPDGEAAAYLRALADGMVFDVKSNPADKLGGLKSERDILEYAIGLEKDSVALYVGMKRMTPKNMGQDKISHIIKEETNHIAMLSGELKMLSQK